MDFREGLFLSEVVWSRVRTNYEIFFYSPVVFIFVETTTSMSGLKIPFSSSRVAYLFRIISRVDGNLKN